MTFILNLPFYFVVAAIIVVVTVWLPPKVAPSQSPAVQTTNPQ